MIVLQEACSLSIEPTSLDLNSQFCGERVIESEYTISFYVTYYINICDSTGKISPTGTFCF